MNPALRRAVAPFLAAMAVGAFAQQPSYTMLVPAEPGSDWARVGRTLGAAMVSIKAASGVVIDNKPGAGGTAGLALFVKTAKGDPHALLVGGQDMVAAAELDRTAPRVHEASPVARLAVSHYVVFVPAGSPYRSMAELARAFKADPAALAWDVGAVGSPEHLLCAFIARTVGADPAKIRTLAGPRGGGTAAAGIARMRELAEPIRTGRVRALAVSGPKATARIPTLKEQGINVLFGHWHGLFAAPGMKPTQRDDLLARVKAATETPAWTAMLREQGWTPVFQQGSDYARFIDEESRSLGYLADSMGLRKK